MNTKDALKKLGELAEQSGDNAYERTKLAALLLADREWIAAEHGGDDWKAMDTLEVKFFHDLAVPLTDLILLYQRFPKKEWAANGYNLRKMLTLAKPAPGQSQPREVRRVTLKEMEKVIAEKREFAAANRTLDKNLTAARTEVETLRERVTTLERENVKLKGRIEELERIVEGKLNRKAS